MMSHNEELQLITSSLIPEPLKEISVNSILLDSENKEYRNRVLEMEAK
jgi:hypothetical protein